MAGMEVAMRHDPAGTFNKTVTAEALGGSRNDAIERNTRAVAENTRQMLQKMDQAGSGSGGPAVFG